jgi:hypothetical protein
VISITLAGPRPGTDSGPGAEVNYRPFRLLFRASTKDNGDDTS